MKQKKILSIAFILTLFSTLLPSYALANVNNGGLSGGCNTITDCGTDDFYAGKCNPHIAVLNDCAAIVGSGSNQLSFSCTQGCTGSCLPGYISCNGVCITPQADDGDIAPGDGVVDGKSCSVANLSFNQCTGQCGSCAAGYELIKGVCMSLASVEARVTILEVVAPAMINLFSDILNKFGAGATGTNVITALTALLDGATPTELAAFSTAIGNLTFAPSSSQALDSVTAAVDGIIDVLNSLMTQLGASNVTTIVNTLSQLLTATTPAQITQYQNTLAQQLSNFSISLSSGIGVYVGSTTTAYNGNRSGYQTANSICTADIPGSHICSADEMINSYNQNTAALSSLNESAWVNAGPPGYISNVANDCNGWKSTLSTVFGYVWDGVNDASLITPCNLQRKFACCQ